MPPLTSPFHRRCFLQFLVSGAVMAGGLAGMRPGWAMKAAPGVNKMTGDFRINGAAGEIGALVRAGDTLTTGPESTGVFTVGDDAFLLRENSEVGLEGEDFSTRTLNVLAGGVLGVFGPKELTIETPTATAGIRGTAAYTTIETGRTYLCICYGKATLTSKAAFTMIEGVETIHHDAPRWIYGPGSEHPISPAHMKNHHDAELVMLEALVGRVPDFDMDIYGR